MADQIPTGWTRWAIVIAASLGTAVFDLTWMIVGIALPHMQGTFSASPDQIAWVMTSFIVGGTMMIAATGWASSRFGMKRLYVTAIIGNTVATLMCGLAGSLEAEVFWRFMQGALSAPLLALGQTYTIAAFPPEKRGFAVGLWGFTGVSAVVVAPVLGGYLVEFLNWRWCFYANVPLGIVSTAAAVAFLPRSDPDPSRRMDWFGFVALMVMVGAFELALSRGERLDWFESSEIRVQFAIALVATLIVVGRNLTSRTPFFSNGMFTDKNYLASIVFMLVFGGLVSLPIVLLPLLLQDVNGYPVITAGALMLPRGVGSAVSLLVTGILVTRFDPRLVLVFGYLLTAVPNWYMSTWTPEVSESAISWTNLAMGCSSGVVYIPMVSIALATLPARLHTEAITFLFLLFNLGSAAGVAIIFAVHTRLVQINYSVLIEHINPANPMLRSGWLPDAWDLDTQEGLAAIAAEIADQAQMMAYLNSFLLIAVVAVAVLPLCLIVTRPK